MSAFQADRESASLSSRTKIIPEMLLSVRGTRLLPEQTKVRLLPPEPFRGQLTVSCLAVNQVIGVQIPAPEPILTGCSSVSDERLLWKQEVAGASPVTPTKIHAALV